MLKTLVPWFGGNRTLAEFISKNVPKTCNHITVPFAGGCPELLYFTANTIIVNDKHQLLINLCKTVADPLVSQEFKRRLDHTLFHESELLAAQARLRSTPPEFSMPNPSVAYDYFISCWMSRNGTAGTNGELSSGISYRRDGVGGDSAVRFRSAVQSIQIWQRALQRCTFLCRDAIELIADVKDSDQNVIYCDPPFPDVGNNYKHTMSDFDHAKLAHTVARFKRARVIMRFYDHPIVRLLYPAPLWRWGHHYGRKCTNELGHEVLLTLN